MKKSCQFCNSSNIANQTIYESENFFCVYSLKPIFPGHTLVIPKRHVEKFLELNQNELKELPFVTQKIVRAIIKAYSTDAYNIFIQDGQAAGQTVPHFHLHVLPRKKEDIPENVDWYLYAVQQETNRRTASEEEIIENVDKIKKFLGG